MIYTKILPNNDIIKHIHNTYYKEKAPDNKHISSYWKMCSENFDIELDNKGNVTSLLSDSLLGIQDKKDPVAYLHTLEMIKRPSTLKLIRPSMKILKAIDQHFSFTVAKQIYTLDIIMKNLSMKMKYSRHLNIMVIGDGYGFLSSLIKETIPDSTIVMVDIGKTLLFQAVSCQKAHPDKSHHFITEEFGSYYDFVYCPTELLEKLDFNFDIVINSGSMGEMSNKIIARYFSFIRKHTYKDNLFYCCNREIKHPQGEAVEFYKYPWVVGDRHIIDEECFFHKHYFSGDWRDHLRPKLFGIRIPFVIFFGNRVLHRLSVLKIWS